MEYGKVVFIWALALSIGFAVLLFGSIILLDFIEGEPEPHCREDLYDERGVLRPCE